MGLPSGTAIEADYLMKGSMSMKLQSSHRLACLMLSLAVALTSELARATDFLWNVPNGDFNTDTNWNPAGLPGMFDRAFINNGGTSTFASGIGTIDTLSVASASGTSGTLNMTGGDLFSSLVHFGDAGTATVSVSSAILRAGGGSLFVGGSGDTSNG